MFKFRKTEQDKILEDINKQPDRAERKEEKEAKKEIEKNFDLDTALNDSGFTEFLAKYPDAENLEMAENNKTIQERYLRFKDQVNLSETLKKIFVGQIKLESGIEMKNEDFDDVNNYIELMAIEDPKRFDKVLNSKKMLERSIQEIQKTQIEIEEVLGKLSKNDIEKKIEDLEYAKSQNLFKRIFNKEARQKREDILEKYNISPNDLKEALSIESGKIDTLEKLDSIQEAILKQFTDAQEKLISKELQPLQEARQKVLEKILGELAIIDAKGEEAEIGDLDKVAEKIKKVEDSGNYIPEYQENLEIIKKDLEEMTQKLLSQKIEDTLSSFSDNKISTLETNLKKTFEKITTRGLNTEENKIMIMEKLKDLANSEKSMAKKLLIRRIIIKFQK